MRFPTLPRQEVASMRRRAKARRQNRHNAELGLPDLEHVKSAVLVSLRSPESQRSYRRSIDDFVCWYDWLGAADIRRGKLFRCVCRKGTVWGSEITEKVVWHDVKEYAGRLGISKLAPHDLRRS